MPVRWIKERARELGGLDHHGDLDSQCYAPPHIEDDCVCPVPLAPVQHVIVLAVVPRGVVACTAPTPLAKLVCSCSLGVRQPPGQACPDLPLTLCKQLGSSTVEVREVESEGIGDEEVWKRV
jgi:hypothetical protein